MSATVKICIVAIGLSAVIAPALADTVVTERVLRIHEVDLALNGGLEPALERYYRSDAMDAGLFGPGWSSRYEARLIFPGNGTAVIREYGCNKELVFEPTADANRLTAYHCGCHDLVKLGDAWVRHRPEGKAETFDLEGRLIHSRDRNGNWLAIEHGSNGRIAAVADNFGRRLLFTYGEDGKLARVMSDDGRQASYGYDPKGRVIAVLTGDTLVHEYAYDDQNRVTEIVRTQASGAEEGPSKATSRQSVAYDPNQATAVSEFTKADGSVWVYASVETEAYRLFDETRKSARGDVVFQHRQLQLFRTGERRYWREFQGQGNAITDVEYNHLGLPVIRKESNGDETIYRYDDSGRMVLKQSRSEITRLSYDAKSGTKSRVEHLYPDGERHWVSIRHNAQGNVKAIWNDRGDRITLSYDANGRATTVSDGRKRVVMTYNRDSRLTELAMPGVGKLLVTHNRDGSIASTDGGRVVASQVYAIFGKLVDITREADAN